MLFDEIPTKASILEDFSEDNRWNVLNQIYITYKEILNANNLTDIFIERKKFIQNYKDNSVILDSEVLFLNIPDLNKVFCEISKKIKSPIKHLIFASEDYSNYFDEYGNVKVSEWIKSDLNISNKKATSSGIFVSTGAMGIFLGSKSATIGFNKFYIVYLSSKY